MFQNFILSVYLFRSKFAKYLGTQSKIAALALTAGKSPKMIFWDILTKNNVGLMHSQGREPDFVV